MKQKHVFVLLGSLDPLFTFAQPCYELANSTFRLEGWHPQSLLVASV